MRDKIWFMAVVLGGLSAFLGGMLAFVNVHTSLVLEQRIFNQTILPTLNEALSPYQPTNDFFKDKIKQSIGEDAMGRKRFADVYPAKQGEKTVATATVIDGRGYGGVFTILVAMDMDSNKIILTKTLRHNETKNSGARIAQNGEPFLQQFLGMDIKPNLKLTSKGGTIDGIAGATITSAAFVKSVNMATQMAAATKE